MISRRIAYILLAGALVAGAHHRAYVFRQGVVQEVERYRAARLRHRL